MNAGRTWDRKVVCIPKQDTLHWKSPSVKKKVNIETNKKRALELLYLSLCILETYFVLWVNWYVPGPKFIPENVGRNATDRQRKNYARSSACIKFHSAADH